LEVRIEQCVHYCGFRYGKRQFNPYETYSIEYHDGVPIREVRRKFIDFLQHYRPRHMAEALGLSGLSRRYPLWVYPWQELEPAGYPDSWFDSPDAMTDIMTQFCETGILSHRIEQEFFWLERVCYSIVENGYDPERHRGPGAALTCYSPVTTLMLTRKDGNSVHLLLDGNHRVSALSALGHETVLVERSPTDTIREQDCQSWYGVRRGTYSLGDALRIFHAYFDGNRDGCTTQTAAAILGPESWKELYVV